MGAAKANQILLTQQVYSEIAGQMRCEALGELPLKGKAQPITIYALQGLLTE
jgi:class 3 adenylate cyclase